MSINYQFKYMPLVGKLPGESMARQTETAINEIAEIVNENVAQAEIINTLAQDANNNSVEALEKANEALQTTGRVYVNVEGVVNLDNYCQSELLWIRNASSTNLPIQHSGFLEVKTNSDKTHAEQIFIDDSSGIVYSRAGTITAQQVGEVINYVASYGEWVTIATDTYVTAEITDRLGDYAPLVSPAFTGTPTAPTPTNGDNSTKLATTEFVKNNYLPLNGGTMSGIITRGGGGAILANRNTDDTFLLLTGASDYLRGACISLSGKDRANYNGKFELIARDGTTTKTLTGAPDGALSWDGNSIITSMGGNISRRFVFNTNIAAMRAVNDNFLIIGGGTEYNNGGYLALSGGERATNAGTFELNARTSSQVSTLIGKPDGTLTWNNENVLTSAGGTITGAIESGAVTPFRLRYNGTIGETPSSGRDAYAYSFVDSNGTAFGGLYNQVTTAGNTSIRLFSNHWSDNALRGVTLYCFANDTVTFYPNNDNSYTLGDGSHRWKQLYAGTTTISTSDERLKDNIESIPDAVLDAWGEVGWYQYQFKDSIEEKGETKARLHTGAIAQRIESVFESHGLDANKYGLLCYDEWKYEPAERDEDGNIVQEARPAGNRYSLRYEEALCMEAAYQRRRADRLEERIARLEALLN